MSGTTDESGNMRYAAREVVGVFPTASALETAVEQLEIAGVNRAAISVLGVDAERSGRIGAVSLSRSDRGRPSSTTGGLRVAGIANRGGRHSQSPCR